MSSIKELDTLSLRKIYYLLSIDLRYRLTEGAYGNEKDGELLARDLCNKALDEFDISIDENEIYDFFVKPLICHLEPLSHIGDKHTRGEYALSIHHFEFRSAVALFLSGFAK